MFNQEYIMQGSLQGYDDINKIELKVRKAPKTTWVKYPKKRSKIDIFKEERTVYEPDYLKNVEYFADAEGGVGMFNEEEEFEGLGGSKRRRQIVNLIAIAMLGTMGAVFIKRQLDKKKTEAVTVEERKQVEDLEKTMEVYGPPPPPKTEAEKLRIKQKAEAILPKVKANMGDYVKDLAPAVAPLVVQELQKRGIDPVFATTEDVRDIVNPPFYKKYMWWLIGGGFGIMLAAGIFLKSKQKKITTTSVE